MNLLRTLIDDIESNSPEPLARLDLASTKSEELVRISEALVSHFVDACRHAEVPWGQIALHLRTEHQTSAVPTLAESTEAPRVKEHHGKYRPLWQWLMQQKVSEVHVTFSAIEEVLGAPLPRSSRHHLPHWYGYGGSAVARAIIDAGWRARRVNLEDETVTLVRAAS